MKTATAESIDMTPTWSSLVPGFVAVLQNGTREGQDIAIRELMRLAKFADDTNAMIARKEGQE
jgi:hypothetical protein